LRSVEKRLIEAAKNGVRKLQPEFRLSGQWRHSPYSPPRDPRRSSTLMTEAQYLSGRLLLAMPGMADQRFDHAVIAMCVHDEHGALGIGIGSVREGVTLHGLLKDIGIEPGLAPDVPIMNGGPVETARGFVLHTTDWAGPASVEVTPLCALSASMEFAARDRCGQGPVQVARRIGLCRLGRRAA